MTRVAGGGLSRNPFGHVEARRAAGPENLQRQLEQELFGGRKKPTLVDDDSRKGEERLALLGAWVKKLARFAGDDEGDYRVRFAKDTIAMIDGDGLIMVGTGFLDAHEGDLAVVVGVLAHEVGHRPKRWRAYRAEQPRTKEELQRLCRLEETRADHFAGRALGAFDLDHAPVCRLLLELEARAAAAPSSPSSSSSLSKAIRRDGQHDYFPAKVRAEVIAEAAGESRRQDSLRRSMFPELARLSARHDLGMG